MSFLRRFSLKPQEEYTTIPSPQSTAPTASPPKDRKPSLAIPPAKEHELIYQLTTNFHDPEFPPTAVNPPINVFPHFTSTRPEILLFTPSTTTHGYTVTGISHGDSFHFMTIDIPSSSTSALNTTRHARHFHGAIDPKRPTHTSNLGTLDRDTLSLKKRHIFLDPKLGRRLVQIEFESSLKTLRREVHASIYIVNKYGHGEPIEPRQLRWQSQWATAEGKIIWEDKPVVIIKKTSKVMVRSRGGENDEFSRELDGYIIYVVPGLDLFVPIVVLVAVLDRLGDVSSARAEGMES